jgi:hypothetical protein
MRRLGIKSNLYLLLIPLIYLVQCGPNQELLTDQQIWRGYIAVTTRQAVVPDEEDEAIARAQDQYFVWRLVNNGKVTTPSVQTTPNSCLPPELHGQEKSAQAHLVLVHIVSKKDENVHLPLFFTQWNGTTDWFVHTSSEPNQCYRISPKP